MVNLDKPVSLRRRPAMAPPVDPARAYGFRLLVAARCRPVSLRKPVRLVKDLRRADVRAQRHAANAGRTLRRIRAEVASSGAVSLRRGGLAHPDFWLVAA